MTFLWPHLLWLAAVPALLLLGDGLRPGRDRRSGPPPRILVGEAGRRRFRLRGAFRPRRSAVRWRLALGLAFLAAALARPQWGRVEEPVFDQSREILVALDLSRSMLADDVKPSRLERSRLLVQGLLDNLEGERVGLLVFSGTAFLQSPLSSDYEVLREFLPQLTPDYLPSGGTDLRALLDAALDAFGASASADRFLIVLSDGEAQADDWRPAAEKLKERGIKVVALGVGTEAGAMIPDGNGGFVKDARGAVVLSKLYAANLRQLAELTGGRYADASSWVDLAQLVSSTVGLGRAGEFKEAGRIRLIERFQWPLAAGLLLLAWSLWREFPVRPRPRALPVAAALALLLLAAVPRTARAAEEPADPAQRLSSLVAALADRPASNAADYRRLADQTHAYGEALRQASQPVPEGPIRDALEAVERGRRLTPKAKAAEWDQLRDKLKALLTPPPEQKQPESKPQPKEDSKGDKGDDASPQAGGKSDPAQGQDSASQDQSPSSKPEPKDSAQSQAGDKKDAAQPGESSASSDTPPSGSQSSDAPPSSPAGSAFGEMADAKDKQPAPPPSGTPSAEPPSAETQQVGGVQLRDSAEVTDPRLAIPLEQLERARANDSPARLFQLMQDPRPENTPAPAGQDW